jgi:hypothetical protein
VKKARVPLTNPESLHDEQAALALIKKIHAAGGQRLTKDEVLEFIAKPVYMGPVERLPAGKRGKRTKRTQYDEATTRRKRVYHKLKRLPESGAAVLAEFTATEQKRVSKLLEHVRDVPRRKQVSKAMGLLADGGIERSRNTVSDWLVNLGLRK